MEINLFKIHLNHAVKKIITVMFLLLLLSGRTNSQSLDWAGRMGGADDDFAYSIATDRHGNVYTTGTFSGTADFDPGAGTFFLTASGANDIFISKLDASGNFIWAKQIGGAGSYAVGESITIDDGGNIYTTGYFYGTPDFDPGTGAYYFTSFSINSDIFVLKLDSSGDFIWAKQLGGLNYEVGKSITIDAKENVYLTGYFNGTADFDPGPGVSILTPVGSPNAFVCKLDSSGNLIWAKALGVDVITVSGGCKGFSIATDNDGNVYTTGTFSDTADFDPGPGIYNLISSSGVDYDIFLSKLDSSGNFIYARQMGSGSASGLPDEGHSIKVDANKNIYLTGNFGGTADFDPGAGVYNLTSAGGFDIFVSKLDSAGDFIWAKQFMGLYNDFGNSVAIDAAGNVYMTGYFGGTVDFDPGSGVYNLTPSGNSDVFISALDASGNFLWAGKIGGPGNDEGHSIAADSSGNIYAAGLFNSTADFDPGIGIYNLNSAGSADAFAVKLNAITSVINENNSFNSIVISPDPASGYLKLCFGVQSQNVEIKINNILGETEMSKIVSGNNCETGIDISSLRNGIYFLQVTDGNKIFKGKPFIKQ